MNRCSAGMSRNPCAAAIAMSNSTKPTGNSQTRLNHRPRPTRTRGATPSAAGSEPAHVSGSTIASPLDKRARYSAGDAASPTDSRGSRDMAPPSPRSRQHPRHPARFSFRRFGLPLSQPPDWSVTPGARDPCWRRTIHRERDAHMDGAGRGTGRRFLSFGLFRAWVQNDRP
jgi:hypothetical protein